MSTSPVKLTVEHHDNTYNERSKAYMRGWYCIVERDGLRNSRRVRDFDEGVTVGVAIAHRMMGSS